MLHVTSRDAPGVRMRCLCTGSGWRWQTAVWVTAARSRSWKDARHWSFSTSPAASASRMLLSLPSPQARPFLGFYFSLPWVSGSRRRRHLPAFASAVTQLLLLSHVAACLELRLRLRVPMTAATGTPTYLHLHTGAIHLLLSPAPALSCHPCLCRRPYPLARASPLALATGAACACLRTLLVRGCSVTLPALSALLLTVRAARASRP